MAPLCSSLSVGVTPRQSQYSFIDLNFAIERTTAEPRAPFPREDIRQLIDIMNSAAACQCRPSYFMITCQLYLPAIEKSSPPGAAPNAHPHVISTIGMSAMNEVSGIIDYCALARINVVLSEFDV